MEPKNKESNRIQELSEKEKELDFRISQLPYKGTPEIKEINGKKYLYVRFRELGRVKSRYVGRYDDNLFLALTKSHSDFRKLMREKRENERQMSLLGFSLDALPPNVRLNAAFARANMAAIVYDQAILEGIATTFPQTEQILNDEKVSGMIPSDIQKIINLKRAWKFILEDSILSYPTDLAVLQSVNRLVEQGLIPTNGELRSTVSIRITGTSYVPPIPDREKLIAAIKSISSGKDSLLDKAISLALLSMKGQFFQDGNKRTGILFANHFLISHAGGILVIPFDKVPSFRNVLVDYYESNDDRKARSFLKEKCYLPFFPPEKKEKDNEMDR